MTINWWREATEMHWQNVRSDQPGTRSRRLKSPPQGIYNTLRLLSREVGGSPGITRRHLESPAIGP